MLEQAFFFTTVRTVLDLGGKGLFSLQLFYFLPPERNLRWGWRGAVISMHIYLINDMPASLSSPVPFSIASYRKSAITLQQIIE